jgi:uncharacterized protein involved in high-affinity Fe2+ transport
MNTTTMSRVLVAVAVVAVALQKLDITHPQRDCFAPLQAAVGQHYHQIQRNVALLTEGAVYQ